MDHNIGHNKSLINRISGKYLKTTTIFFNTEILSKHFCREHDAVSFIGTIVN